MAELARGTVIDRPWGKTLAALASRGLTGQLTVTDGDKRYILVFTDGAIAGARSPSASDSAIRIAMSAGIINSTQAGDLSRKLAANPNSDEVSLVAQAANLPPDQVRKVRRRAIAQQAARSFALEKGNFILEDSQSVPSFPESAIDVRAIVFMGARQMLTEQRLAADFASFPSQLQLVPAAVASLPQFGFAESERGILELLNSGPRTLAELDAASTGIEPRMVRAVVYALYCAGALAADTARQVARPSKGVNQSQSNLVPPAPIVERSSNRISGRVGASAVAAAAGQPVAASASGHVAGAVTGPSSAPRPTMAPSPASASRPTMAPSPAAPPATPRTVTPSKLAATAASAGQRVDTGGAPIGAASPAGSAPVATSASNSVTGAANSRPSGRAANGSAPPANRVAAMPRGTNNPAGSEAAADGVAALIAERIALLKRGASHFELLGVAEETPTEALRTAYFTLARQLHPDKLTALGLVEIKQEAQRLFAQINTAFSTLTNPERRQQYLAVMRQGGEAAVRAKQEAAEAQATRILAAEEAFHKGEQALRRNQFDVAAQAFAAAIELNADEGDYHAMLAWSKFCLATDKNAAAAETRRMLDKAVKLAPRSLNAVLYYGRVERMLGNAAAAIRHFEDVLARSPGNSEAASELRVLKQRKQSDSQEKAAKAKPGLFSRSKK